MAQLPQDDEKTAVDWGQGPDQTVVSSPPPSPPPTPPPTPPPSGEPPDESSKKRGPWLWIIVAALVVLLCVIVAGAGGILLLGDQLGIGSGGKTANTEVAPTMTDEPVEELTATPEAEEDVPTATTEPTATDEAEPASPVPEPSPTEVEVPEEETPVVEEPPVEGEMVAFIGPISFASMATDDGEPVDVATTFPADVEEIHAFFTYEGMVDGTDWERSWYQDGEPVGGGSGSWDEGASGLYHLSLNGGGEPLGAGKWQLEIYVDGKILQSGRFEVEADSGTSSSQDATPEPTEAAVDATPTSDDAPVASGRTYKVAFSRWDGGKHDMYIVNTDGSQEQYLFQRAAGPSWSPDGDYLSFFGEQGVDRQMVDGVEYVQEGISDGILYLNVATWSPDITKVEVSQFAKDGTARWTAWAPNGSMVAYDAAHGGPDLRIYFLGTDDNQQYDIEILGEQAGWAPDSNQLVYRSGRDNKQGIWISNRDDSGATLITSDGSDAFPRWSPDGRKIVFTREAAGNVDIYTMNVDGSNVRRLTDTPGPDTLPAWTPDGAQIVFRSARDGNWGIYIMNADSSNQRLIVSHAGLGPDWSFGRMDVR